LWPWQIYKAQTPTPTQPQEVKQAIHAEQP
jgi:hypothetical protein